MRNQKIFFPKLILFVLVVGMVSFGFIEGDKKGNLQKKNYTLGKTNQSGKQGDAYRMNINNLNIPISRVGTIADVNIPPDGTLGRFGVGTFLFSGGFMMSGYTNGSLWAFAQASASLIENMVPGTVASGPNDPDAVMYVLKREDPPFSLGWQDWKTAVDKFGADYYNGDGVAGYDPVDRNGNGVWDPDEDAPDLLGDETAWCVYTDGQPGAQRLRFAGVNPQGVEIRQTVFAFASKGALGNIMFVRYRIKNTGLVADRLDSVLFGVWADPDVGTDFENDLTGVDVPRNAGFMYNSEGVDPAYGVAQPCFMIDFFLGPRAYIAGETYIDINGNGVYDSGTDTPQDTAYSYRGQLLGVTEHPGAKNLDISSFTQYIQSDPTRGDPGTEFEARNYMNGRLKLGEILDPCLPDAWGSVINTNCATIDSRFWYSGDPVTNTGWLMTTGTDQRQMTNVGPITLNKDEEIEILVAYLIGQGTDRLSSVTVARAIDDGAQFIFDGNFRAPVPPPTLNPVVESGEDFIDFVFPTDKQVGFNDSTSAWEDKFHSINVFAYKVNSTQDLIAGEQNSKLYTSYERDYFVKALYKENAETGGIELLYPEADSINKLNYETFSDPTTGRIRLRVTTDPFSGGPLIKGKPYYFSFTSTAINYKALVNKNGLAFGTPGDYYLSTAGFVAEVENVPKIITVVLGEDMYDPPVENLLPVEKFAGPSLGKIGNDIVDKASLKNNEYEVSFFTDTSSVEYKMFWRLKDLQTGQVLLDSANYYLYDDPDYVATNVTDGFITKIEKQTAAVGTVTYEPLADQWYNTFDTVQVTGVYYVGKDLPTGRSLVSFPDKQSDYISADKLRKVEIRFGTSGKAYRFLNGFKGVPLSNGYKFASLITASDTVNKGKVGNWDQVNDRANGFVDVPFTVWVADDRYPNDTRQLAVGFVERKITNAFPKANPDGIWDPSDSLLANGEVILIFDAEYDPTGNQIEITGGEFRDSSGNVISTVWSDLLRAHTGTNLPKIPANANVTSEQRAVFNSSWLNAMYVVGLEKRSPTTFYNQGDILTIPLAVYPYTESDVYRFKINTELLGEDQLRTLFEKVNVYPNPLYAFNVATSYNNGSPDEPFVTFSNLPEEVSIKIYSLSGQLLRTLGIEDKSSPTSPFLRWNLQNESGLRVASGMYFAIVTSPNYGEKVLKFAIIMPQKQIQKY